MQPRIRAITALTVLLAFWGMLAYDFRAELTPVIQQVETSLNPIETKTYNSPHFQIQDQADTTSEAMDALIAMLEANYEQIAAQSGVDARNPIEVNIRPGDTIATMSGGQIVLSYDAEMTIHTELAPAMLAMLIRGDGRIRGNLFLSMGQAIYIVEEMGLPTGMVHSSDGWAAHTFSKG